MDNPYEAPSPGSAIADLSRRPVGVSILSVLTGIMSLVLLILFVVLLVNWRENNEWALQRRMAPSILWFCTSTSVVLAFFAAIGMWRGHKWGWWITCSMLTLFVIGDFGRAATTTPSLGAPSFTVFFIVRGIILAAVLAYWLRTRVRKYFHVEQTSRIKAIVLSALCGIGITAMITVVLQGIFFFRSR
jgi:hypothetical protein